MCQIDPTCGWGSHCFIDPLNLELMLLAHFINEKTKVQVGEASFFL